MSDFNVVDNRVVFSSAEIQALSDLVQSGDRAGFYLAYYGMTDSSEALLQAKITTFSGLSGGAALAANRFLQDQYSQYPGIYYLSEQVALSGLDAITADLDTGGTGKIMDQAFFESARAAWINAG